VNESLAFALLLLRMLRHVPPVYACNDGSANVRDRQIFVRNNSGSAAVDVGASFGSLNWSFIEVGVRYKKTGSTTIQQSIFVETADGWNYQTGTNGPTVQDWTLPAFGCNVTTTQPRLRVTRIGTLGAYWQPSVDCGAGYVNIPKTLSSMASTNHALGETEIHGYFIASGSQGTTVWPSMTDTHSLNQFRTTSGVWAAWMNYRCYQQTGSPPWHPTQAAAGYSIVSGASACNANF
jgi:hypothetical protein